VEHWLAEHGHEAWSAFDAGLADAQDEDLLAYAYRRRAVLVTTNRDRAQLARKLRSARVIRLV
jgi:predicted nuclease of predicted toxin-antitoxin system